MRFNNLDLNLLVALDMLLSEQNVSQAAKRMNMTQSAMSNALTRLRDYFEDKLLIQVGRRMELTPRAELLKHSVRDVLVRVEASIATHPAFLPQHSDRLFKICISDYTMTSLIPHVLFLASMKSRSIRFELLPQSDVPRRTLERGDADLLVIPKGYCSPEHPSEFLLPEEFVCVAWKDGEYGKRDMTFDDYLTAGHAVVKTPGTLEPYETTILNRLGIQRKIEIETFSFASLPYLVCGTDRIANVHRRIAKQAARLLPIRLHKPPFDIPGMEQSMQWHEYRTNDPGIVWLRQLFHDAVTHMTATTDDGVPINLRSGDQGRQATAAV